MTRMLHVASERSSSGCNRLKRTLILPSVMGALVPLASSIMSVKQLYTCAPQGVKEREKSGPTQRAKRWACVLKRTHGT